MPIMNFITLLFGVPLLFLQATVLASPISLSSDLTPNAQIDTVVPQGSDNSNSTSLESRCISRTATVPFPAATSALS